MEIKANINRVSDGSFEYQIEAAEGPAYIKLFVSGSYCQVCLYVCSYVCMLVHMFVRMFVCLFVCLFVYERENNFICNNINPDCKTK